MQNERMKKAILAALLIVVGLLSFFVLAKSATDVQTYAHTIEAIDDKKATVMTFTATAATASTAIAAIPGDASTPIANQIMEISKYLFIVVCFLVLEKSMLTVMGFLAFKVLIPIACVCGVVYLLTRRKSLVVFGAKLAVFAVVIAAIIPLSVVISDMIYDVNSATVEELTAQVDATVPTETVPEETEAEDKGWWESLTDAVDKTVDGVVDGVQGAVAYTGEKAEELLNKFIDAIALFVIAYCAIPVVVVLVIVWLVKFLFQLPMPVIPVNRKRSLWKDNNAENTELAEV